MIKCSHCRIFAAFGDEFVIIRSHGDNLGDRPMTNLKTETTAKIPALDVAVTLDQLVAPLEVPADLSRARWAPKWTLILPIAMLAAFTVPALPVDANAPTGTPATHVA
tara:strand:- start:319 stop:642 length:324 start_codon:yes stop_codon:yes gene_type:complete